jgi:lysyl-tRNA synthetase class I
MSKVENIEREIQKLAPSELEAFRRWFREYDSDEWDRQIDEDARAGKLDKLAEEALAAHRAGKSKEL